MDIVGDRNLADFFDELALTNGKKTAIIFENEAGEITEISYESLNKQINKTANLFISLGIAKGDKIALHLKNSPEFIISLIACAKIGAVAVPINANYFYQDLLFIIKKTKPIAVITQDEYIQIYERAQKSVGKFKSGIMIARLDKNSSSKYINLALAMDKFSKELKLNYKISPLDTAQIIFTSGTSSFPKGVVLTHYNLIFAGYYTSWQACIASDDRYLTSMPLWHIDAQCTACMPTLASGATLILLERYSARKFWSQIIAHKATITEIIPKMIYTLMCQPVKPDEKNHKLREVFYYLNLSEKEMLKFRQRFNLSVPLSSYGMTETIVGIIGDRPNQRRKYPSIGRVGFCYEAKIVDKKNRELPPLKKGEICIKGELGKTLFNGYYQNSKATKEALDKNGWLHTKDIGYMDEMGYFYFVDRNVNLIKVAGENVSSVEIETFINSYEKVFESAVIGVKDKICGQIIKACVVPKQGANLNKQEIIEYCAKNLAKFKVPTIVEFYESLPKTCTAKVKKNILRSEHLKENLKG